MAPDHYPSPHGFSDDAPNTEDDADGKFICLMFLENGGQISSYSLEKGGNVTKEGKMAWLRCDVDDPRENYIHLDRWVYMTDPMDGLQRYCYESKWVSFYRFDAQYPCFNMRYRESKQGGAFYTTRAGFKESIHVRDDESLEYYCGCADDFDHCDHEALNFFAGYPSDFYECNLRAAWEQAFLSE